MLTILFIFVIVQAVIWFSLFGFTHSNFLLVTKKEDDMMLEKWKGTDLKVQALEKTIKDYEKENKLSMTRWREEMEHVVRYMNEELEDLKVDKAANQAAAAQNQKGVLVPFRKQKLTNRRGPNVDHFGTSKYKRKLMFLHVAKSGGTAFGQYGNELARKANYNYIGSGGGNKHFDWNTIEKQGTVGKDVEVLMLLRHPVARAISHFYYIKPQKFTADAKMRKQTLSEYLFDGDKQNLLKSRDIWQDGQAGVSWITGTHIANWVGCPKEEVEARERRALNATAMTLLAAERLQQVKWFGILEDLERSQELLQYEFNLTKRPSWKHANENKKKLHTNYTTEDMEGLTSLMPQDLLFYEYAKRLFEARWQAYKTGKYTAPELPTLPDPLSCISTRFQLNCTSGPFIGDFRAVF